MSKRIVHIFSFRCSAHGLISKVVVMHILQDLRTLISEPVTVVVLVKSVTIILMFS